ncbi:carbon storage regulator [Metapseudomonas otitidis]|uniref:carbon storage regulator n=1 Tax=Metapseudomonas otitidis TaxID=319939 RepID=UPI002096FFC1|nr:carbon storage regulator [Pseudomonas otitidis]MCO7555094.1 carbon storage regulator [Pseudomonas otitidis]
MKIITRTPGEAIRINDDITIVVLPRQEAGGVQLGIIAPRSVKVVRQELMNRQPRVKRA